MASRLARTAAVLAGLFVARRYYRNWGTTKEECRSVLPGDELVGRLALQSTEGVWIDAPVEAVWPWLLQIGQQRAGLYLNDTLQAALGLGHHSADDICQDWQHLAAGDVVRLAPMGWMGRRHGIVLTVAQVIDREAIVLRAAPPDFPWEAVWSVHVMARWQDRCRLLVRTRARLHYPGQAVVIELATPVIALLTRAMLVGIKDRAHRLSTRAAPSN